MPNDRIFVCKRVRLRNGSFCFKGRRLYLIYRGRHDKTRLVKFLANTLVRRSRASNPILESIRCEHDLSDVLPLTRVAIDFGKRYFNSEDPHKLDFDGCHPSWNSIVGISAWRELGDMLDQCPYATNLRTEDKLIDVGTCAAELTSEEESPPKLTRENWSIPALSLTDRNLDRNDNIIKWFYLDKNRVSSLRCNESLDDLGDLYCDENLDDLMDDRIKNLEITRAHKSSLTLWLQLECPGWKYYSINTTDINYISARIIDTLNSLYYDGNQKISGIFFDINNLLLDNPDACEIISNIIHGRSSYFPIFCDLILPYDPNIVMISDSPPLLNDININWSKSIPSCRYEIMEILGNGEVIHI